MQIGIEKLGVHPCALSLDIRDLCDARGLDAGNFCDRLFCRERSVMAPFEDVVTLAVNAALPMVTDADRARIRLLIVATESSPDQEKPVSSWVHAFLGLRPDCRNFEVKHACYGATAAVQMAAAWLAAVGGDADAALVINADHALIGLEGPQEPVLGAGAAAVLISKRPQIVAFDLGWSGVHAHEVSDIFRPAPGVETGDADESLTSYLDGVELAYDAYVRTTDLRVDFDAFFAGNVYHVPFGGLAQRAHVRLARRELGFAKAAAEAHWARKSKASIVYNQRTGGIYGAAPFLALAGLIEHSPHLQPGDRIGIYSYGSGSCAEFYSVTLLPGARAALARARIGERLDARRRITVHEYEACERTLLAATCAPDYAPPLDVVPESAEPCRDGRALRFRGTRSYRREYAWD
jgi:hydroxymethylglutaryl-CoA synthase